MSELKWHSDGGVVWRVLGWPWRTTAPMVSIHEGGGWCVIGDHESHYTTLEAAQIAAMEAALVHVRTVVSGAEALLAKTKQAAQDADDAALVAAHGGVVWSLTAPTRPDGPTYRRAQVAGHPVVVEEFASGHVKWWVEPDYYGHEYTWDAPDVATAMQRATATALRDPCKRWKVTITGGKMCRLGAVEVWARTTDGAVYRGACALGTIDMMAHYAEGRAEEVEG